MCLALSRSPQTVLAHASPVPLIDLPLAETGEWHIETLKIAMLAQGPHA